MSAQLFSIYANALASQVGVNLSFQDIPTAHCSESLDGKKEIVLPKPKSAIMEEDEVKKLVGMTAHELMHYLHTSFSPIRMASKENKILPQMLNVFEDIRIERILSSKYRGGAHVLRDMITVLVKEKFWEPDEKSHPIGALFMAPLMRMRKNILGQPVSELSDMWEDRFNALVPHDIAQQVWNVCDLEAKHMASTEDAYKLANKVVNLLMKEQEQSPGQSPSKDDSGESEEPNGSEDSAESSGSEDQESDNSSSSNSSSDEGESEDNESLDESEGQGGDSDKGDESDEQQNLDDGCSDGENSSEESGSNGSQESASDEMSKNLKEVIENVSAEDVESSFKDLSQSLSESLREAGSTENRVSPCTVKKWKYSELGSGYPRKRLIDSAKRNSNRISQQLRMLLKSREGGQSSRSSYTGKRLNRKAGVYVKAGVTAPCYRQKNQATSGESSLVTLLVDMSSSMSGEKIEQAVQTALAMSFALEGVNNVDLQVMGYTRTLGPELFIIKDVNDNREWKTEFTSYDTNKFGSTPTGEAMCDAIGIMSASKKDKKILFVLTDGLPDNKKAVHIANQMAQNSSIEVIGVIITDNDASTYYQKEIRELFKKHVFVNNKDMQKELLRLLRENS